MTLSAETDEAGAHEQLDVVVSDRVVLAARGRLPLGTVEPHHLGTEHVDLYQVQAWDPRTPVEETLQTLDGFARAGKVGYHGFSNVAAWRLTKAVHVARALDLVATVTVQPQHSLLARELEWEVVPAGQGPRPRHGDLGAARHRAHLAGPGCPR